MPYLTPHVPPAPTMSARQQALTAMVDKHAKTVLEAERWLWAHPQTGFTEWQAHGYLTNRFTALDPAGSPPLYFVTYNDGKAICPPTCGIASCFSV